MNALCYGKPVKLTEDGRDVFSGGGVGEQSGGGVLNILQFLRNRGGETIQDAIAVVESGGDEGVNKCFSGWEGESGSKTCYVPEVEEGCFGDVVYVFFEGECGVHVDAKVSDQGGGSDRVTIDAE